MYQLLLKSIAQETSPSEKLTTITFYIWVNMTEHSPSQNTAWEKVEYKSRCCFDVMKNETQIQLMTTHCPNCLSISQKWSTLCMFVCILFWLNIRQIGPVPLK